MANFPGGLPPAAVNLPAQAPASFLQRLTQRVQTLTQRIQELVNRLFARNNNARLTLQYAPDELRNDPEVVLAAILGPNYQEILQERAASAMRAQNNPGSEG